MPNMAEAHYHLAGCLAQQHRIEEAQSHYLRAIEIHPQYAEAFAAISSIYQAKGQLDLAEQALRESIFLNPQSYVALNNLGNLLKASQRFEEAESCYMQALSIRPEFSAGYNNLGLVLRDQARLEEAEAAFLCALEYQPNSVQALNNLGLVYKETGRLQEAKTQYQKAIAVDAHYAPAYCNLGMAFEAEGDFTNAEIALSAAIQYQPEFAEAFNNIGIVFKDQWRLQEAEKHFKEAIRIKPTYVEAYSNLGSTFKDAGKLLEAEIAYKQALDLNPHYYQAMSNLLFCLTHNPTIDKVALFKAHARFGERFETPLKAQWQAHLQNKDADRPLNIGFVSGDLRNHAVAFFIEPIIAHLANYPQLNLYAYANSNTHDDVSERLASYFKTWRKVARMSDDELAHTIRHDQIDILIDLSGHTAGHRLLTFARKPAPIQASWIGYPGTTGLTAMDYFLADKYLLPPGQLDDQFTEKLVQMPACSPFMPADDAPPVNALPALSNGYITFGSFNRPSKLSQQVINLWASLMQAVPQSKILMGAMSVEGENSQILSWFAEAGISADRIMLHQRSSMQQYLKLHQEVDICLDTFPYNGGTTSWHAIWMGVPTLTMAGDILPSRIGACVLGHVGLDRFVVRNEATFVEEGVFWSENLEALATIRAELRARFAKSPIGKPALVTAGLERALRQMWQNYCQDLPTTSFEISLQDINYYPETQTVSNEENAPIFVTQPLLPALKDYVPYLEQIWKNKFLTNGGPFHQQLERELCDYLGVKHIALFTNGTLALLTALQSLRITGEVITTPYSFVATAHSLLWNGIKPVFVDIDPISLNMDPAKIVAAITPQTTAIMPVHCYGHPCEVEAIQKIADDYNLKVIYDAAHAFGVRKDGESVLLHGDLSVLSFHATKVFNTFEGGAIICPDAKTKARIDHLKNFGFVDEQTVVATGINGKMSEINAAFGLLQLKGIDAALQKRKEIDALYRQQLANITGIVCIPSAGEDVANYSYFPILVKADYPMARDALYQKLRDAGIYARRYFYPLISDFPMYRGLPSAAHDNLTVARQAANEVICLPIFPDLTPEQVARIVSYIRD
jgi:protein O-GlcNAc transferase